MDYAVFATPIMVDSLSEQKPFMEETSIGRGSGAFVLDFISTRDAAGLLLEHLNKAFGSIEAAAELPKLCACPTIESQGLSWLR